MSSTSFSRPPGTPYGTAMTVSAFHRLISTLSVPIRRRMSWAKVSGSITGPGSSIIRPLPGGGGRRGAHQHDNAALGGEVGDRLGGGFVRNSKDEEQVKSIEALRLQA